MASCLNYFAGFTFKNCNIIKNETTMINGLALFSHDGQCKLIANVVISILFNSTQYLTIHKVHRFLNV